MAKSIPALLTVAVVAPAILASFLASASSGGVGVRRHTSLPSPSTPATATRSEGSARTRGGEAAASEELREEGSPEEAREEELAEREGPSRPPLRRAPSRHGGALLRWAGHGASCAPPAREKTGAAAPEEAAGE
ncbi:unnamed protein product [Urochloa humidicola]